MPLLMIPGPIEVSPAVVEACAGPPPGHLAPPFMQAFQRALVAMREVWCAGASSQPFVVAGSGTIAMEMAATNVVEPGDRVVVASTGYFSWRMSEMLRRRGAEVAQVDAEPGAAPSIEALRDALKPGAKALFATHVDTSTGVRCDAKAIAALATEHGALSVFDGVCATAAERFEMEAWGADVYLTASQKAIGLPAGLALLVASDKAQAARAAMKVAPPMSLDFEQWAPIMQAYEAGKPSYFSTPATTLVRALAVGLEEILSAGGMNARFALHQKGADAFRAAFVAMGCDFVPRSPDLYANTLSAVRYPDGVDASLVGRIKERGIVVAGGLHPEIKSEYFRVGHMGDVLNRKDALHETVRAIAGALSASGRPDATDAALAAFDSAFNAS